MEGLKFSGGELQKIARKGQRTNEKLYLPALVIMVMVLILLILTFISTFRNLNRHKKQAIERVHRHGLSLVQSLEAIHCSGLSTEWWHSDSMNHLISVLAGNSDISVTTQRK
jgi:hypothetical protein